MASYALVETALARMHGADAEAQKGAFRGRMKHLQRLGLPLGEKPGKGKRMDYSDEQIWQLALALELSEFGVDPTTIVEMISAYWSLMFGPNLQDQAEAKARTGSVLAISVALMSAGWCPVAERMPGLLSLKWIKEDELANVLAKKNTRRIIVIDTWRMIHELNDHLKKQASK